MIKVLYINSDNSNTLKKKKYYSLYYKLIRNV